MTRPISPFHNFVGHKKLVKLLRRQLAGAQAREKPFPHTLFTGASGLGKTLLAEALAAEFATTLHKTSGYLSKAELADRLVTLKTHDFIFIDECHAMKIPVQELLLDAIDHLKVSATVEIKPFSILLATDQPGALVNALQKRMVLRVALAYYPIGELKAICERMAKRLGLAIGAQAARLIAQVSAGQPRRVAHHLQNLRNHFPDSEAGDLGIPQVREFLRAFDIDDKGLGPQEHQYLNYLKEVGSASLESLAICLGLDPDYVRHQVEPLLLRERLVKISPGGRQLTAKGLEWITQKRDNSQEKDDHGQD